MIRALRTVRLWAAGSAVLLLALQQCTGESDDRQSSTGVTCSHAGGCGHDGGVVEGGTRADTGAVSDGPELRIDARTEDALHVIDASVADAVEDACDPEDVCDFEPLECHDGQVVELINPCGCGPLQSPVVYTCTQGCRADHPWPAFESPADPREMCAEWAQALDGSGSD